MCLNFLCRVAESWNRADIGRGGELARKLRSVHVAQPGLRVSLQLPQSNLNTLPVCLADALIASD